VSEPVIRALPPVADHLDTARAAIAAAFGPIVVLFGEVCDLGLAGGLPRVLRSGITT